MKSNNDQDNSGSGGEFFGCLIAPFIASPITILVVLIGTIIHLLLNK